MEKLIEQKSTEPKLFFYNVNKIVKPLARWAKKRRENYNYQNLLSFLNERENISHQPYRNKKDCKGTLLTATYQ